jgi:hypothetical protein
MNKIDEQYMTVRNSNARQTERRRQSLIVYPTNAAFSHHLDIKMIKRLSQQAKPS